MKKLDLEQMRIITGGIEPTVIEDPTDPPDEPEDVVKFKAGSDLSNTVQ